MITLQDVYEARNRISKHIKITPVISDDYINKLIGQEVYFKLENFQTTHAFKIRGSANKILQLSSSEKERGVITASTGNHGQGFSCIADRMGIDAIVVVPKNAVEKKIRAIKHWGAKIILHGGNYDEASIFAHKLAEEQKKIYIHSFDDEQIIAGNGTIFLELLKVVPDIDMVIAPIGGGGLISGISFAAKNINPKIQVIGVQTEGAPSMFKSFKKKRVITLKSISTIADGIAVSRPGEINFQYARRFVDDIVLVSDQEIRESIRFLHEKLNIVVEGAGAAAFAAVINKKVKKQKLVACIVSGGNIDLKLLLEILSKGKK